MSKISTRNKKDAQEKIIGICVDPEILKLARARGDEDFIQKAVRNCGWERAYKNEVVIKALSKVGINPKNCFFDQEDNLIIPCKEIQRNKKIPFLCNIGWHKPIRKRFHEGQMHADCARCWKDLIRDSQGGWF